MLDFSKLEAGQVAIRAEPCDVAGLCRASLDLFTPQAGSKDIGLRLEIDPSAESTFRVDPDRVRQILLNLVGNGVKFTEAGEVVLSVAHRPLDGSTGGLGARTPETALPRTRPSTCSSGSRRSTAP